MALRTLMLKKRLDEKRAALAELQKVDFEAREKELEQAIEEADTDEEKSVVQEEIEKFESEKEENEKNQNDLKDEIEGLEKELEEAEAQAPASDERHEDKPHEERKDVNIMPIKTRYADMSIEQRTAFVQREDVKEFLGRVREMIKEKRSVTGGDLLIPTVVLSLIRQNIEDYSKLIKHVNVKPVPGKARQTVMGVIPEAVWTEMCGRLNELDISFAGVELDGYKVGGFIPVCNATLEDSDIDLANEIIVAIGQAIGLALDKAIIYGTGTKMPLGVFTRLAETSQPSDPRVLLPWVDYHTANVKTIANTYSGKALFQQIVLQSGAAKGKYSRGTKTWVMNETTYNKILAEAVEFNAAGAIVSQVNGQMPVVGGAIEVLDFIQDDVIIGGYFDLYILAERAGASIEESRHVKFIDDQTVYKGTARYDGTPVIANAFVAIGINGATPSASGITFAEDTANFQ